MHPGSSVWIGENHRIRKLDPNTAAVTTFAGGLSSGFADGVGTNAEFDAPTDAVEIGANFYVTDRNNDCIRRISTATAAVDTIAGWHTNAHSNDGVGTNAGIVGKSTVDALERPSRSTANLLRAPSDRNSPTGRRSLDLHHHARRYTRTRPCRPARIRLYPPN